MIVGLLLIIIIVVLAVLGMRKVADREQGPAAEGHAIRRFFQYLLLYGLLVVVAVGLSGLLGRLLDQGTLATADESALARSLAFTVVGLPLYAGVALWSRRRFGEDRSEAGSFGWAFYTTAALLTSLVVAMTSLHSTLVWAVGLGPDDVPALARFIVWGAIWGVHWWLHLRLVPADRSRVHHLTGSLIGLATAATGLAGLLGGALETLLDMGGEELLATGDNRALRGAVTLAVGAPVWFLYWLRTSAKGERDPLWLGYVLLAGVGGGLVTAVVSASTVLYDVLVWFLGDPATSDASRHFGALPSAAATAVVGVVVWWYHQAVLGEARVTGRTEVQRIYEYLMSAIGLVSAGVGLMMLQVAAIEALIGSEAEILGQSAVNTLLLAATLLVVGGPVWWSYWHRIQNAAQSTPLEHAAPTRRIYLFVLFGLGGVVAVVALLVGVYLLFEDVVAGTFASETIRSMRYPIGILVTTGAIAGYHWAVYRGERELAHAAAPHGPRYVLLVGPPDPDIAQAVAHSTGGRVQAWATDDGGAPWSADAVVAALAATTDDEVLVLSDAAGLHAIPVHRR